MHDPRVGRFFAPDPAEDKFPWNSQYAFSENRVLDGFELEGLEVANTIIKRALKTGLKKATKEFIEHEIKDRLKAYATKKWARQLLADADKALELAEDSWWEIIGETVIEQVPYAGPAYSVYDFAKENKHLWDAIQKIHNKSEKILEKVK